MIKKQTPDRLFRINKPEGISSFAALFSVKKLLGISKVGHAGTLDPFAGGLLIVLSGKLTKTISFIQNQHKEYEAVFTFGAETDTLDTEGNIIAKAKIPDIDSIKIAAENFKGKISQKPPSFSAVKVNGRRAYELSRRGESVDIPVRTVEIYDFKIISWNKPDLKVYIKCSKGTYIRSIARDLGLASGSRAYCSELKRTAVGSFLLENAVSPDNINEKSGYMPADYFNKAGFSNYQVEDRLSVLISNGYPPETLLNDYPVKEGEIFYLTDSEENVLALLEKKEGRIKYAAVF